ncbi:ABC transporter permease [Egicoccus sp. AB-alg6-2]|uniref:ABC transporter permease n=1 Tax=Egicoccus sp. AB-alg6-2 TaxID=3242692 RepID=UPI00359D3C87
MSFLDYITDAGTQRVLVDLSLEHVALTASAVVAGGIIGLLLGVIAQRVAVLRVAIVNLTALLLTIPSLALFAILIPLVGIGFQPAVVALTLYSLLPIVRNTVSGLQGVDAATVEAAKGMGMGGMKRLLRIELPTAWPVILAGLRVSTLLVIGIAAVAALVGGPGLGNEIFRGIRRIGSVGAVESIAGGTVAIVVLALLFDLLYLAIGRLTISRGLRD